METNFIRNHQLGYLKRYQTIGHLHQYSSKNSTYKIMLKSINNYAKKKQPYDFKNVWFLNLNKKCNDKLYKVLLDNNDNYCTFQMN